MAAGAHSGITRQVLRGRFITFEGGEGSGKSTHAKVLAEHLKSLGIDLIHTREPGGSPGAEVIRHIILSGIAKPLGAETEAVLFAAARDDHVRTVIRPALVLTVVAILLLTRIPGRWRIAILVGLYALAVTWRIAEHSLPICHILLTEEFERRQRYDRGRDAFRRQQVSRLRRDADL